MSIIKKSSFFYITMLVLTGIINFLPLFKMLSQRTHVDIVEKNSWETLYIYERMATRTNVKIMNGTRISSFYQETNAHTLITFIFYFVFIIIWCRNMICQKFKRFMHAEKHNFFLCLRKDDVRIWRHVSIAGVRLNRHKNMTD